MDYSETERLLAAAERVAKAFERIADALEKSNAESASFHQYIMTPVNIQENI